MRSISQWIILNENKPLSLFGGGKSNFNSFLAKTATQVLESGERLVHLQSELSCLRRIHEDNMKEIAEKDICITKLQANIQLLQQEGADTLAQVCKGLHVYYSGLLFAHIHMHVPRILHMQQLLTCGVIKHTFTHLVPVNLAIFFAWPTFSFTALQDVVLRWVSWCFRLVFLDYVTGTSFVPQIAEMWLPAHFFFSFLLLSDFSSPSWM